MGQDGLASDWPAGVDRVILEEVDSTSLEATRRAPTVPTWIMARKQTAAKGRRGRAWSMPPGNFAASFAWRPGGDPARMALRSFTASLALHDVLTAMGAAGLSLKWPNDVLLNERKLAGILLEAPQPGLLILGIGVNLTAAPDPALLDEMLVQLAKEGFKAESPLDIPTLIRINPKFEKRIEPPDYSGL